MRKGTDNMHTDPIADLLTRIRNATGVRHAQVTAPSSKMKVSVARVLREEGYIQGYDVTKDRPQPMLRIWLKYTEDGDSVISALERVSKPGCRVYADTRELPRVKSGLGIAILSTSSGIMTDKKARRMGIGGEVLCYVW
jgi:small subunit ribosomal protein S8